MHSLRHSPCGKSGPPGHGIWTCHSDLPGVKLARPVSTGPGRDCQERLAAEYGNDDALGQWMSVNDPRLQRMSAAAADPSAADADAEDDLEDDL